MAGSDRGRGRNRDPIRSGAGACATVEDPGKCSEGPWGDAQIRREAGGSCTGLLQCPATVVEEPRWLRYVIPYNIIKQSRRVCVLEYYGVHSAGRGRQSV